MVRGKWKSRGKTIYWLVYIVAIINRGGREGGEREGGRIDKEQNKFGKVKRHWTPYLVLLTTQTMHAV